MGILTLTFIVIVTLIIGDFLIDESARRWGEHLRHDLVTWVVCGTFSLVIAIGLASFYWILVVL